MKVDWDLVTIIYAKYVKAFMKENEIESFADFTDPDNEEYYTSLNIKIEGTDDIDQYILDQTVILDADTEELKK